ncbi:TetR/AcrR family transcriptional regulator [Swingsia samuiensis]|uniref:TetR/AcrR family transcriptional regulator n=1 Tax=Swingsia samuiensis TaxID=1293412 RepID=A0A4Y6UHK1_9PROT|nr:TetR/AcrR family transcriptional regulator [Swingsia samuiensis]QDH17069.1 TetR/AcrR family transcriptional regulator [Swingsia samuiensis]
MIKPIDARSHLSPQKIQAITCQMNNKKEQILRGAEKVFLAVGYERASMSQIAREAGVSKGTLYNHFDGKASLFSAFFEEQTTTKLATIDALAKENNKSIQENISQFVAAIIHLMISPISQALYRILISEVTQFPNLADTFWRYGYTRTLNTLSEWLSKKHHNGDLFVPDPSFAAEQLLMLCQARIVHRKRFMLPVDDSQKAINQLISLTTDAFMKIYAPHP